MKSYFIFAFAFAIAANTFAEQVLYCAGTVRYPSGETAAGVRVEYYPGHHDGAGYYAEVKTDANGRYEIIGQKDTRIFMGIIVKTNCIMARDPEKNLAAVQDFYMTITNVDLVLQPAITLSGSVKDTDGRPIVLAEVDLRFGANQTSELLEAQPIRVNELGQFSMPALPQGREYEVLEIAAKGYGSGRAGIAAKDTRTTRYEFPPFVLKRADRKIAGHVIDFDGKPLAGAEVYFMGRGQPMNSRTNWGHSPWCNTNTDSEGRFQFDNVCDAPLRVYANYRDPLDRSLYMNLNGGGGMEAQVGDTNIVIRFPAPNK